MNIIDIKITVEQNIYNMEHRISKAAIKSQNNIMFLSYLFSTIKQF